MADRKWEWRKGRDPASRWGDPLWPGEAYIEMEGTV